MKLIKYFFICFFTISAFCVSLTSCEKKISAKKVSRAKEVSDTLQDHGIRFSEQEVQAMMDGMIPEIAYKSTCPPINYANPFGFVYPLGDSTQVNGYRVVKRIFQGDTIFAFSTKDLINLLSEFDYNIPNDGFSIYDLSYSDPPAINMDDLLILIQWYGLVIPECELKYVSIGESYFGQPDFFSSGVGIVYHQEIHPMLIDGELFELIDFPNGMSNGVLHRSLYDENWPYTSCWNSCHLQFYTFDSPKYTLLKD